MIYRIKFSSLVLGVISAILFASPVKAVFCLGGSCVNKQQEQKDSVCQASLDSLGGHGTAKYDGGSKFNGCQITCDDGYYRTISGSCQIQPNKNTDENSIKPELVTAISSTTGDQTDDKTDAENQIKIKELEERVRALESQTTISTTVIPKQNNSKSNMTVVTPVKDVEKEPKVIIEQEVKPSNIETSSQISQKKVSWFTRIFNWFKRK